MGDDEEQRLVVWKLRVGVRVRSLSLKLNLKRRLSTWKIHRFSFLVKFGKHRFKVDSQSELGSLRLSKWRSLAIFRRLRFRRRRKLSEVDTFMDRWIVIAKKATGVGVITLIIIILNFLQRWIKFNSANTDW